MNIEVEDMPTTVRPYGEGCQFEMRDGTFVFSKIPFTPHASTMELYKKHLNCGGIK